MKYHKKALRFFCVLCWIIYLIRCSLVNNRAKNNSTWPSVSHFSCQSHTIFPTVYSRWNGSCMLLVMVVVVLLLLLLLLFPLPLSVTIAITVATVAIVGYQIPLLLPVPYSHQMHRHSFFSTSRMRGIGWDQRTARHEEWKQLKLLNLLAKYFEDKFIDFISIQIVRGHGQLHSLLSANHCTICLSWLYSTSKRECDKPSVNVYTIFARNIHTQCVCVHDVALPPIHSKFNPFRCQFLFCTWAKSEYRHTHTHTQLIQ